MTFRLFDGGEDEKTELFEDLPDDPVSPAQARSSRAGKEFDHEAFAFLEELGGRIEDRYLTVQGYSMDALVSCKNGNRFYIDAHGTPDRTDRAQAGIRRTDTLLKFGFKALRLAQRGCEHPLLLITSHLPRPDSQAAYLLTELNDVLYDVVATSGDLRGAQRLHTYFNEEPPPGRWLSAPWREVQMPLDFSLLDEGCEDDA